MHVWPAELFMTYTDVTQKKKRKGKDFLIFKCLVDLALEH